MRTSGVLIYHVVVGCIGSGDISLSQALSPPVPVTVNASIKANPGGTV